MRRSDHIFKLKVKHYNITVLPKDHDRVHGKKICYISRISSQLADLTPVQEQTFLPVCRCSLVLVEGIAGWAKGGAAYTKWIDEYDPEIWHKD